MERWENVPVNWGEDKLFSQGEHNFFMLPDFCDFDGIVLGIQKEGV